MISGLIYLYSYSLNIIDSFFAFIVPFPPPSVLINVIDTLYSFWLYIVYAVPQTAVTLAAIFWFSVTFIIMVKVIGLVRLPFTMIERLFDTGHNSVSLPKGSSFSRDSSSPRSRLIGDVSNPISSKSK